MISSASEHSACDGSVTVYVVAPIWINNIVKNVVIRIFSSGYPTPNAALPGETGLALAVQSGMQFSNTRQNKPPFRLVVASK